MLNLKYTILSILLLGIGALVSNPIIASERSMGLLDNEGNKWAIAYEDTNEANLVMRSENVREHEEKIKTEKLKAKLEGLAARYPAVVDGVSAYPKNTSQYSHHNPTPKEFQVDEIDYKLMPAHKVSKKESNKKSNKYIAAATKVTQKVISYLFPKDEDKDQEAKIIESDVTKLKRAEAKIKNKDDVNSVMRSENIREQEKVVKAEKTKAELEKLYNDNPEVAKNVSAYPREKAEEKIPVVEAKKPEVAEVKIPVVEAKKPEVDEENKIKESNVTKLKNAEAKLAEEQKKDLNNVMRSENVREQEKKLAEEKKIQESDVTKLKDAEADLDKKEADMKADFLKRIAKAEDKKDKKKVIEEIAKEMSMTVPQLEDYLDLKTESKFKRDEKKYEKKLAKEKAEKEAKELAEEEEEKDCFNCEIKKEMSALERQIARLKKKIKKLTGDDEDEKERDERREDYIASDFKLLQLLITPITEMIKTNQLMVQMFAQSLNQTTQMNNSIFQDMYNRSMQNGMISPERTYLMLPQSNTSNSREDALMDMYLAPEKYYFQNPFLGQERNSVGTIEFDFNEPGVNGINWGQTQQRQPAQQMQQSQRLIQI